MAITFNLSELTSRSVRSDIGTRLIRTGDLSTQFDRQGNIAQQIIGAVISGLGSLGGFIVSRIGGFFSFSWTKFWSWFTNVRKFLWNFNLQATDKELDDSIRSQFNGLMAQLGGTLGNLVGYTVCGIIPSAVVAVFNRPMGAYMLSKILPEAAEEFLSNFGALLDSVLNIGTRIAITETYKHARRFIKSQSKAIGKLFGSEAERIVNAWGNEGNEPWSFAKANEEYREKTFGAGTAWDQFFEELQEEADEACVEAGFVIASAADEFEAMQLLGQQETHVLGNERIVEVTPNRNVPDERIVLAGREQVLRPMIMDYLSTYEQIRTRDVGVIYGTVAADMPERKHRPEVVLKFYRKQNTNPKKGAIAKAASMQIAFRLMDKTHKDFASKEYAVKLAEAVKREFATPPFEIEIGYKTFTYADFEKGYQFKLDVKDAVEAQRIIKKVLDIQGHRFESERFRIGSIKADSAGDAKAEALEKEKYTILGNNVEVPKRTREGNVTFVSAYVHLGIRVDPIDLIDLRGKRNGLVTA